MSLVLEFHDYIDGEFLLALMEKHRLLPDTAAHNPALLKLFAESSRCVSIRDETEYKVFLLETPINPGVIDLTCFILDRDVIKRRGEIESFQEELRAHWFSNGVRRVQGYIPITRKNTKRLFVFLGFIQETRDCGLRNLFKINGREESCIAMGLLPNDPIRTNDFKAEVMNA